MQILITSGGTKVPIDPVRDITNMSHGTFGSQIAHAALEAGAHVHYMISKGGRTPFSITSDFYQNKDWTGALNDFARVHNFANAHNGKYHEYPYRDLAEYAEALEANVKYIKPEVVILAAAVSDYYVLNPCAAKIRDPEQLTVELAPAPKLIRMVKQWCPTTFLVGFKLLVDQTDDLVSAMVEQVAKSNCDMVVGNDLSAIKAGRHEIMILKASDSSCTKHTDNLADTVIKTILAELYGVKA
jgi:phosphopantothenoylcysteine synthetase/decarboxylase